MAVLKQQLVVTVTSGDNAPWLIIFFSERHAHSAIPTAQCDHCPFCLFCLIWEGKDLMAEVFCF